MWSHPLAHARIQLRAPPPLSTTSLPLCCCLASFCFPAFLCVADEVRGGEGRFAQERICTPFFRSPALVTLSELTHTPPYRRKPGAPAESSSSHFFVSRSRTRSGLQACCISNVTPNGDDASGASVPNAPTAAGLLPPPVPSFSFTSPQQRRVRMSCTALAQAWAGCTLVVRNLCVRCGPILLQMPRRILPFLPVPPCLLVSRLSFLICIISTTTGPSWGV